MIINEINNKWRNIYICFYFILFVLLLFKMNLIAVFICICAFLYSSFSTYYNYIKRASTSKKVETMKGGKRKDRKFLINLIGLSLGSAIIVLGKESIPKFIIGLILLVFLLDALNVFVESIFSKRKLPLLLANLQQDSNIKNFEDVINAYISVKDLTNASIYCDKAMHKYPDTAVLLALKSRIYRCLDEDDKAVPFIKKALALEPQNKIVRKESLSLERIGFKLFPP